MKDKVQLIRQEIERRIKNLEFSLENNCVEKHSKLDILGNITTLESLLKFIDPLPEESASEDLDRLVISLEETIGTSPHSRKVIKEHLQKAAEWGRNHFEDKSEMVGEDLEEAANQHSKQVFHGLLVEDNITAFKAGAEWQKQKDQETIELAEDHAMLAGMNRMKEEMMKDAVETTIVNDWQYGKDPDHAIIPAIHQRIEGFNIIGDKVKIIIVKTEQ